MKLKKIQPIVMIPMVAVLIFLYANFSLYQQLSSSGFVVLSLVFLASFACLLMYIYLQVQGRKTLIKTLNHNLEISINMSTEALHDVNLNRCSPEEKIFVGLLNTHIAKSAANYSLFSDVASKLAIQANELSVSASDIELQMQNQSDKTKRVEEIITKLQTTISVATEVASDASALANKSEIEGDSGKLSMTNAITGVMMLGMTVNEAGNIIQKLGEDSQSISGIIDVITGVAEQTNLLALNAAIEAARAGEQGRGFAVVADEVRTLASKTQSSASQIHEIISLLLSHVDEASEVIQRSVTQADDADELMEGVTISYSELVGFMGEVSTLSAQLSQETLKGNGVAAGAVHQLAEISETSSVTLNEAKKLIAASMEMGKMGEQLNLLLGMASENSETPRDNTEDDVELF